jgi:hypothetical protein
VCGQAELTLKKKKRSSSKAATTRFLGMLHGRSDLPDHIQRQDHLLAAAKRSGASARRRINALEHQVRERDARISELES